MSNFDLFLIIAAVVFAVDAVAQILGRAVPGLQSAGLVLVACAFVTLP